MRGRYVVVAAGLLVGLVIVAWAGSGGPGSWQSVPFRIWDALAVGLTTAAGIVFHIGQRDYAGIRSLLTTEQQRAVAISTVVLVTVLSAITLAWLALFPTEGNLRGPILLVTAIVGATNVART